MDATGTLPQDLVGAYDVVVINNPKNYIPNLAQLGLALRPGGKIIVQGNTGRNPEFKALVNNVRTPRGFRKKIDFNPRRDLPPEYSPRDIEAIRKNILGGPFYRTEGEQKVFPNYRVTFTMTK